LLKTVKWLDERSGTQYLDTYTTKEMRRWFMNHDRHNVWHAKCHRRFAILVT
jgi:hypothetical protein